MAFGEGVETQYHFDKAKRVLSLDADFTACGAASVRHARHFALGRQVVDGQKAEMNRLYVVEVHAVQYRGPWRITACR